MIRSYSELAEIPTFEGRYEYLALKGAVGEATFGFDRWMNQQFYRSAEWRHIRNHVIARDYACDLATPGYDIHERVYVHHMNPIEREDLIHGSEDIIDPEFLISTTHRTHNAIHYGDRSLLPRRYEPRRPGDTTLWRKD